MNAFDGSKFYYEQRGHSSRTRHQHEKASKYAIPAANDTTPTPPPPTTTTIANDDQFQTNDNNYQMTNEKSLAVELTPSLFQLKELNLKCRTIVEQPLIEYESQLIASVATSPFIQADHHHQHNYNQPTNNRLFRPSTNRSSLQRHGANRQQSGSNNYNNDNSAVQRSRHKSNNVYTNKPRQYQSSGSLSSWINMKNLPFAWLNLGLLLLFTNFVAPEYTIELNYCSFLT